MQPIAQQPVGEHDAVGKAEVNRGEFLDSEGQTQSRFFEPQRLSGLETMRFTTARRVEGSYTGRHIARSRGGSGEFVDYREYSPGDDLRRLDWKALGRTGRSYLKLFQDETDLRCTLALDCSGSMLQGAQSSRDLRNSKLQWMQYFATALSHIIVLGRDAVGLCTIGKDIEHYLPPSSSMQQRGLVHSNIESIRAEGETDLAAGLDSLLLQSTRRGVLLTMSDFLVDPIDGLVASYRKFRARGWEVVALHLVHPEEEHLPRGVAYRFQDLEGEGTVNCQLAEIRSAYEARFQTHLQETRSALLGAECDYHLVRTSDSYLDVLRSFLVKRSA